MTPRLYINNDNVISIPALVDKDTSAPITDANVSVTLTDLMGVEVGGVVWPQSVPHSEGGEYKATLRGLSLEVGKRYRAEVGVSSGGYGDANWFVEVWADHRRN